ncbi:MAG: cytochrome c oxidase subunit II [Geminicoccaceae bacterium]|nr:cytochrome c oxidase subunit II [Geminicoccaceae bacterium]
MRRLAAIATALTIAFKASLAAAAQPVDWEINLQPAATLIMEQVRSFHTLLSWIISFIVLLVLCLLAYVCWRFNAERHPKPSRRSHHTVLEVVWTAVPVLVLVIIAIPSFKLLYYMDDLPKTEMTIKATGHQWYWSYEYPDQGDFQFDAYLVDAADLKPGQPRLLTTDNYVVMPANTNVRVQTTATDVIHSWAMPSAGLKIDAVPGRLNEIWVNFEQPGMYYGQCSELCGVNHGFMPITIQVVTKEQFTAWVEKAKQEFARADAPATQVAAR